MTPVSVAAVSVTPVAGMVWASGRESAAANGAAAAVIIRAATAAGSTRASLVTQRPSADPGVGLSDVARSCSMDDAGDAGGADATGSPPGQGRVARADGHGPPRAQVPHVHGAPHDAGDGARARLARR